MQFVDQKYRDLVIQYLSGDCSPEDTEMLINWIQSGDENFRYFIEVKELWEASDNEEIAADFDIENSWKLFKKRLEIIENKKVKVRRLTTTMSIVRYVASIAATLLISFFLWNNFAPEKENIIQMVASGDNSEDLLLPDGSLVKLNYNSTIYFPETFDDDIRKVRVEGEVYFDVRPNPEKPFVVDCGDVNVEVKGTSFDIQKNTDKNETIVIVTEGMVKVWEKDNEDHYIFIEKGGSFRFDGKLKNFEIYKADRNFLSWKTHFLQFENAPLDTVLETLEDHFRVEIFTHSEVDLKLPLSTQFDGNTLEETLDVIAMIFDLEYSIDNNEVKIQNK